MPATNAHLHDKSIYYKDGIFCDAPKKLEEAVHDTSGARVYHWEERDLLPYVTKELSESLKNAIIWKSGNGFLRFEDVRLEGDCAMSIRKGKKILVYSLKARALIKGVRGDVLDFGSDIITREICHDDDLELTENDLTIEHQTLNSTGTERALKTQELFATLLRKKAKPAFLAALRTTLLKLQDHGTGPVSSASLCSDAATPAAPPTAPVVVV